MGMIRKVVGLSLAGIIVLCLAVGGTWAYLHDSETSSNNQVSAGTLAMTTNNAYGVTGTLTATNLKPGRTIGPSIITLKNVGSHTAASLNVAFSYVKSDVVPNTVVMTADQVASVLQVTTLSYDFGNLLPVYALHDVNGNGYVDLQDLANFPLTGLSGLNPSASKDFAIAVQMRSGTSSNYCGDGIDVTMTFVLNQ